MRLIPIKVQSLFRRSRSRLLGGACARAGHVVVFGLPRVELELLLQVAAVRSDVAEPHGRRVGKLVLHGGVPGLRTAILPIPGVPNRGERGTVGDLHDALSVDLRVRDDIDGRGPADERIVEIRVLPVDIRGESQIQWRVVPGRLQDLRERHRPEVFSVRSTQHRFLADLERGAQTGAEVVVVGAEQTARHACRLRRRIGQAAPGPGLEHRRRYARKILNAIVAGRDHFELVEHGVDVRDDEPVVFFAIRRPLVPAHSQIQRQTRIDSPLVGEIQPGFRLAEVEETPVVLVGEKTRHPQEHIGESGSGKGDDVVVGRAVQGCPGSGKVMRSLGLLELPDVVPLHAQLAAELDGVLALVPCRVVLEDAARQRLVFSIVGVPAEFGVPADGIHGRPSLRSKRVRHAQRRGPVLEIGQRSPAPVRAMSADEQFVQQRGGKRTGVIDGDVVDHGIGSRGPETG